MSAGPTREYLDDVRFLSSPSTGRMGFALANSFARAGHVVSLITGPSEETPPSGVEVVRVESASEMRREILRRSKHADAVLMSAAVSDFRPRKRLSGKVKKSSVPLLLKLVPTPDILGELGRRKSPGATRSGEKDQLLVGFALEVGNGLASAARKLREKNLDFIVANGPATFGSDRITCTLLGRDGSRRNFKNVTKKSLAEVILRLVCDRLG